MVFGISLFLYGERYNERADQIKSCYLELKKLYESQLDIGTKMQRYSEVLDRYENQSNLDYDEMVFDAYLRGQKLQNSQGPVEVSWFVFFKIALWRVVRFFGVTILFLAPVIAGLFWITPVGHK